MKMESDKKKEAINTSLDFFISKGLLGTTTRDLSNAMKLQGSGLYYYFSSKEDAIITCAEEAAHRLETILIIPALEETSNPEQMINHIIVAADKMAPTMKFFVQVCAMPEYQKSMHPVLDRLTQGYENYSLRFANKIGCTVEEITPYVYMCITAMSNYMLFGESAYIVPQLELVKKKLDELLKK